MSELDGFGGLRVPHIHDVIDVVTKCNEEIKEKFTTGFHFRLHGSRAFECLATADDEGEVMSAEARIRVRRVVIGIPRTTQNCADFDSTLQTLLPKRQALELLETVLFCRAVYDSILEEILSHAGDIGCSFYGSATASIF